MSVLTDSASEAGLVGAGEAAASSSVCGPAGVVVWTGVGGAAAPFSAGRSAGSLRQKRSGMGLSLPEMFFMIALDGGLGGSITSLMSLAAKLAESSQSVGSSPGPQPPHVGVHH